MTQEQTTYTFDEAMAGSTAYYRGDELAAKAFVTKYALRNAEGQLLEKEPPQAQRRMAREFARIESRYSNPMSEDEIYELLSRPEGRELGMGPVVPQGSPMSAIGNAFKVQSLSNCFVIPSPEDSYGGIMMTDQQEAQIMKRRGGVGFDISSIRPRGMRTANAAGTTDGLSVFMERYSNTCREVGQGGRRGALMLTVDVRHPEVCRFINAKRDRTKVTGANISVRVTDEFMYAVAVDGEYTQRWPMEAAVEAAKVVQKVRARDVWEQIVDAAWDSAEPGVLFWDNVTRRGPADAYSMWGYGSISTNPCGEITLSAYDSCRLMVIDLTHFVVAPFTSQAKFDFARFETVAGKAQRLMDDLVDLELEAIDRILAKINDDPESPDSKVAEHELWLKIREAAVNGRRTGLGVTGLGDAIAQLGIRYGSSDSVNITDRVYHSLCLGAYRSTVQMAKERGAFPIHSNDIDFGHQFLIQVANEDAKLKTAWEKHGRRNIALTTTAPVGTVSMLTQTTSGIEPAYLLNYKRRKKLVQDEIDHGARVDLVDKLGDKWQEYDVYHHGFRQWMQATGESDVAKSPYAGATSADVDWVASVDVQAAAQRWICHSISKTCNLPRDASHELISEVYQRAWKSGCKGFTIYRDGSRDGVLVSESGAKFDLVTRFNDVPHEEIRRFIDIGRKHASWMPDAHLKHLDDVEAFLNGGRGVSQPTTVMETHAPKRLKMLECDIHRATVKGEGYLVLVGLFDGKPYEVFCGLSDKVEVPKKFKSGKLVKNGKKDGLATYNLLVPFDDDDDMVFKDVVSLFDNPTYGSFTRMLSLSLRHGVPVQYVVEQCQKHKHDDMQSFSRSIARVLKSYIPDGTKPTSEKSCFSCGSSNVTYQEGCVVCLGCGNSKCG